VAGNTNIEWTDRSWNSIVGCSVVSPGCTNCYAMRMATRLERISREPGHKNGLDHYRDLTQPSKAGPVWTGKVALAPDHILMAPMRWKKPVRIFVNSMGDLFHESIPDEWIDRVFAVMALAPQHTFQVLTKRSKQMRRYFQIDAKHDYQDRVGNQAETMPELARALKLHGYSRRIGWPLKNVWLGVSAEDQERADDRIPDLLATPAAVRFVSAEPLLGPIDLDGYLHDLDCGDGLDWIIIGGESGKGARKMDLAWARSIIAQCRNAGVACFMKQLGSGTGFNLHDRKGGDPNEWAADLRVQKMPVR